MVFGRMRSSATTQIEFPNLPIPSGASSLAMVVDLIGESAGRSTPRERLRAPWSERDAVDHGVGDAVPRLRVDSRLGERLEPAMRRQDQTAEHRGVGGRIQMPGALGLLDELAAAVQQRFVRGERPCRQRYSDGSRPLRRSPSRCQHRESTRRHRHVTSLRLPERCLPRGATTANPATATRNRLTHDESSWTAAQHSWKRSGV